VKISCCILVYEDWGIDMAKSYGQKAKILYILRYLQEYTDDNKSITTKQILEKLAEEGITCDRKTIYSDMECLKDIGYEIEQEPTRNGGGWKLLSREFELPELKLLVDAVQSSKFITTKKSRELIKKIETLTSNGEATKLNRQVFVASRNKAENEAIFYNVDNIQTAIQENKQISFTYLEWNTKKELVIKGNEKRIENPWALIWKDENYYMLGYDPVKGSAKHYRVDKMRNVDVLKTSREGGDWFSKLDLAGYADTTFSMMGGETENVIFDLPEYLIGVAIDRFGKDITIQKIENNRIRIRVKVQVSDQLYGWLTGLGGEVVIHSPEAVRNGYIKLLKQLISNNEKA